MRSVVAGGPGLIAVGTLSDSDYDPAAWVSTDGLTWDAVPVEGAFDSSDESMNSVTAGGPGFVAVGMDTFVDWDRRWEAAVWVSETGMSWQRVSHPALTLSRVQEMWGITNSGSSLIAVGFSSEIDPQAGDLLDRHDEWDAAVWLSSDGYNWKRTSRNTLTTPDAGGIPDDHEPTVVRGPEGYVAIGCESDTRGERHAVWYSEDGQVWQRIPDASLPGDESTYLFAVTATDDLYAAVGNAPDQPGGQDVVIWLSSDGLIWDEVVFERAGPQEAGAITAFGDEIVAVGFDPEQRYDLIWYSNDGEDWATIALPVGSDEGRPMVAYTDNDQIIILGAYRRPMVGRP